jgi:Fur family peroxide stress response transcriptional regulator
MSDLTAHRQTVLEVVKTSHDHPTARMVFERALKRAPKLSFATVYNSLKYLAEQGRVRQFNFGQDSARYDGMLGRHDHLICRKCGKVEDFNRISPPKAGTDFTVPKGFKVEELSIQITGLCDKCN